MMDAANRINQKRGHGKPDASDSKPRSDKKTKNGKGRKNLEEQVNEQNPNKVDHDHDSL